MVHFSAVILVSALFRLGAPDAVDESQAFITLRDEEFVGPDKRLEAMLARRRSPPPRLLAELAALENVTRSGPRSPPPPAPPTPSYPSASGAPKFRREGSEGSETSTGMDFSGYQPERLKPRILKFQQTLIMLALERMEDVKHLMREHEQDERFRIAFMFCKMEDWLEEMRQMFRSTQLTNVYRANRKHLLYYVLLLRKNIDITYTVEFFLHVHTGFIKLNGTK